MPQLNNNSKPDSNGRDLIQAIIKITLQSMILNTILAKSPQILISTLATTQTTLVELERAGREATRVRIPSMMILGMEEVVIMMMNIKDLKVLIMSSNSKSNKINHLNCSCSTILLILWIKKRRSSNLKTWKRGWKLGRNSTKAKRSNKTILLLQMRENQALTNRERQAEVPLIPNISSKSIINPNLVVDLLWSPKNNSSRLTISNLLQLAHQAHSTERICHQEAVVIICQRIMKSLRLGNLQGHQRILTLLNRQIFLEGSREPQIVPTTNRRRAGLLVWARTSRSHPIPWQ